jgi:hypothetical protein
MRCKDSIMDCGEEMSTERWRCRVRAPDGVWAGRWRVWGLALGVVQTVCVCVVCVLLV